MIATFGTPGVRFLIGGINVAPRKTLKNIINDALNLPVNPLVKEGEFTHWSYLKKILLLMEIRKEANEAGVIATEEKIVEIFDKVAKKKRIKFT